MFGLSNIDQYKRELELVNNNISIVNGKLVDLKRESEIKTEIINELNNVINQLKEFESLADVQIEFDVENTNVYGIDRIGNETVISHKFNNSSKIEILEWSTECSIDQHNALVERFRKKIGI